MYMNPVRLAAAATFCLLAMAGTHARSATVADLAWMTGYWTAPAGEMVLEENWNAPLAGTIAAAVRMSGRDGTQMVELVIIAEQAGTLVLSLQQFNPDFTPRSPAPQRMQLVSTGERTVTFAAAATDTTGLQRLTYSRSDDGTFTVEALLPDGNLFKAPLRARSE